MKGRLPIVLSITAVLIAVAGTTPLGQAASEVVRFARNADKVDGIHASRAPKAGRLLALNSAKKFPASVTVGVTGHEVPTAGSAQDSSSPKVVVINCTPGKRVLGGGYRLTGGGASEVGVTEAFASSASQWTVRAVEINATTASWTLSGYAICANGA